MFLLTLITFVGTFLNPLAVMTHLLSFYEGIWLLLLVDLFNLSGAYFLFFRCDAVFHCKRNEVLTLFPLTVEVLLMLK